MGDAAHTMHPAPGQGANTAFADVLALSTTLKKGDIKNPANLVKEYENDRVTVANQIQALARIKGKGLKQAFGKGTRQPNDK